jgi:HD-GYP domain-containing protein (c-di-GMP phosphodiesterase class II)
MAGARTSAQDRWAARPVLGASLRLLALLGPVAVGLGVALVLARVLPGRGAAAWWVAVLGGSALAVFAADRFARRLLPLAVLLELSLLFPDRAPSRLRAVRTSSVRDIDARLARLRGEGVAMEPYQAAETVVTLVGILGLHDKRTRGHSERVRAFTDLLTSELGLDEDARMRLRWAALVHDLGKLTVPAAVLNGNGGLDGDGWTLMHRHPDEGVRLLAGLLPWLGEWADAVGQHHERYDGTGYPNGIAGEQISYAARIVALADSFEVMTSARSYKAARSAAWARAELTRCAGSQFDPALVRAFLGISLGRLRWVLGPVTWLAELPFVTTADRAGQTVKVASVSALAAGLLLGSGAVPGGQADLPRPQDAGAADAGTAAVITGTAGGAAGGATGGVRLRSATGAPSSAAPPVRSTAAAPPATAGRPGAPPAVRRSAGAAAGAAPRRAPVPGRTAPPAPAAAPAALPPAYHLTANGLSERQPTRQEVRSVPVGGVLVFDKRLDGAVVLPADRDLPVFVRFATRQGSAKLSVRLLDCPSSGTGCTVLSSGQVTQDKHGAPGAFQEHTVPLSRSGPDSERLVAGRVLRVELSVLEPGAKGPAELALGSAATPSRLRLSAGG